MLEYAQEWIHKRIDFLPYVFLKQEFTSIQTALSGTIEFYQSIFKLLTELKGSNDVQGLLKAIQLKISEFPDKMRNYVKTDSEIYVSERIQKIIDTYKLLKIAVPFPSKEHEYGIYFCNKGIYEFSDDSEHFSTYITHLQEYFSLSNIHDLYYKMDKILSRFDNLLKNLDPSKRVNELVEELHSYAKEYTNSYRLEFCIQWIEKRLDQVSNENIKAKLISLKKHFMELKSLHGKVAEVIYRLYQLAIKLFQKDLTEDVANEIVTLIYKLKEFTNIKDIIQNVNKTFYDLINGSKNKSVSILYSLVVINSNLIIIYS